jgi:hypothetical protein
MTKRNKRKVYIQAWQPILIEEDVVHRMFGMQMQTEMTNDEQVEVDEEVNTPGDISFFLDEFDKELQISDIIAWMTNLYHGDMAFISYVEAEIAFDLVVMEHPFSSEEEKSKMKNLVLKRVITD